MQITVDKRYINRMYTLGALLGRTNGGGIGRAICKRAVNWRPPGGQTWSNVVLRESFSTSSPGLVRWFITAARKKEGRKDLRKVGEKACTKSDGEKCEKGGWGVWAPLL